MPLRVTPQCNPGATPEDIGCDRSGFDRHLVKPAEIGALQALLSSL
jgi:hypothetical protein